MGLQTWLAGGTRAAYRGRGSGRRGGASKYAEGGRPDLAIVRDAVSWTSLATAAAPLISASTTSFGNVNPAKPGQRGRLAAPIPLPIPVIRAN